MWHVLACTCTSTTGGWRIHHAHTVVTRLHIICPVYSLMIRCPSFLMGNTGYIHAGQQNTACAHNLAWSTMIYHYLSLSLSTHQWRPIQGLHVNTRLFTPKPENLRWSQGAITFSRRPKVMRAVGSRTGPTISPTYALTPVPMFRVIPQNTAEWLYTKVAINSCPQGQLPLAARNHMQNARISKNDQKSAVASALNLHSQVGRSMIAFHMALWYPIWPWCRVIWRRKCRVPVSGSKPAALVVLVFCTLQHSVGRSDCTSMGHANANQLSMPSVDCIQEL